MNKQLVKGITIGSVLTFALMLGVPVLGQNLTKSINVAYKNIKVYIYGTEKTPSAEPFIYNGTTYVPLRFISEALGEEVHWVDKNSSIYIGQAPPQSNNSSTDYSYLYRDFSGTVFPDIFPYPMVDGEIIPMDDKFRDENGRLYYAYSTPSLGMVGEEFGVDPYLYFADSYAEQLKAAGFVNEKSWDNSALSFWVNENKAASVNMYYDDLERMTFFQFVIGG